MHVGLFCMQISLQENKKIYFASDFHLGAPDPSISFEREKKLVAWLDLISQDANTIFLLGDIFDFWFEYKKVIPKGFVRFQGKLAELCDKGIGIYFFRGNHDMWMFNYFQKEIGIKDIYSDLLRLSVNNKKFLVGHGDGLGKGDHSYKFLKKIFRNRLSQFLFRLVPPVIGIGIAQGWSGKSRKRGEKFTKKEVSEKDRIEDYCKDISQKEEIDYFIFGHRHIIADKKVGNNSTYLNLGEWFLACPYAEFDGKKLELKYFTNKNSE